MKNNKLHKRKRFTVVNRTERAFSIRFVSYGCVRQANMRQRKEMVEKLTKYIALAWKRNVMREVSASNPCFMFVLKHLMFWTSFMFIRFFLFLYSSNSRKENEREKSEAAKDDSQTTRTNRLSMKSAICCWIYYSVRSASHRISWALVKWVT